MIACECECVCVLRTCTYIIFINTHTHGTSSARDGVRCHARCAAMHVCVSVYIFKYVGFVCAFRSARVCACVCRTNIRFYHLLLFSPRNCSLADGTSCTHMNIYMLHTSTVQQYNSSISAAAAAAPRWSTKQQRFHHHYTTPWCTLYIIGRPTDWNDTHTHHAREPSWFWILIRGLCAPGVARARACVCEQMYVCVCARGISTRRVGCCRLGDDYSSAVQLTCDGTEEVAQHDVVKWGVI